jgi:integrase
MARAKHGSYIFQRAGSANWWVKLRGPTSRVEKSLHTIDRQEAEILALPLIAEHKAALLAARPRAEITWRQEYAPGLHDGPNGERIAATERELIYYNVDGKPLRTTPNGGPAIQLVNLERRLGIPFPVLIADVTEEEKARPTVPTKNGDDAILETYLAHSGVTGHSEREARNVWSLYKTLTDSKPLKDASRDDGRKLVAHFEGKGLKSATIEKKLAWLNAAVNLAIKEGRLRFNPFSGVVPKRDDKQTRLPLSEADMKEAKRNLDRLDERDQLLFRVLATTGMRLSEAFEIDSEQKERGCRYVIVGKKTEQSLRRVPLPAAVLPLLPKAIRAPLFQGGPAAASKRLNRFLNDCGIVDPRKVLHSLRHRAQDRLRAFECPQDIRWAILGQRDSPSPVVAAAVRRRRPS